MSRVLFLEVVRGQGLCGRCGHSRRREEDVFRGRDPGEVRRGVADPAVVGAEVVVVVEHVVLVAEVPFARPVQRGDEVEPEGEPVRVVVVADFGFETYKELGYQ